MGSSAKKAQAGEHEKALAEKNCTALFKPASLKKRLATCLEDSVVEQTLTQLKGFLQAKVPVWALLVLAVASVVAGL